MYKNVLWGITGSGDFIEDIVSMMKDVNSIPGVEVRVVTSKAARRVLGLYGVWDSVENGFPSVRPELDSNDPIVVGELQTGRYDVFLVCPATANTTAKISLGIADTVISNAAAMAMKADIPVYIFPVDQKRGTLVTEIPGGGELTITVRDLDVENVERIRAMDGITVLSRPRDFIELAKNEE